MRTIFNPRRAWWIAPLLLGLVGCGGGSSAPTTDPAQARDALRAALDAWKAGDTPETLAQRSPSIHVADFEWSRGFRLVRYQAAESGQRSGFDLNVPVVLELKAPRGKTVKRDAVYTVTTGPRLLVLRQDG